MPLQIVRNDITRMRVDAIVNAADETLLGADGFSVDAAIHRAAGRELLRECAALGGCAPGDAKLTRGYRLPCKYIIHTVGPHWVDGRHGEQNILASCYRSSLALARGRHCRSVAFPLIASGVYGYPKDQALRLAIETIRAFLLENEMLVYLVVFDRAAYQISEALFSDITAYIDDRYADARAVRREPRMRMPSLAEAEDDRNDSWMDTLRAKAPETCSRASQASVAASYSLEDALDEIDESFSEMLLRKINEKGMTDAQCYKKANIDRKLFSKIRTDRRYKPSKPTVIAFALALELPLTEMKDMLFKAGFALSHSNKFDIIVEYFVERGNYNVFEINEALFAFDQSLIGA